MLPSTEGLPDLPDADIHLHQAARQERAASELARFLSEKLRAPPESSSLTRMSASGKCERAPERQE